MHQKPKKIAYFKSEIDELVLSGKPDQEVYTELLLIESMYTNGLSDKDGSCSLLEKDPSFDDPKLKSALEGIKKVADTDPVQLPEGKGTESDAKKKIRSTYPAFYERLTKVLNDTLVYITPSEADIGEAST